MSIDRTDKFIMWGIAGFLAWEAYTLFNKEDDDTISDSVWRAIARDPRKAILLGALAAHFGWQAKHVYEKYKDESK